MATKTTMANAHWEAKAPALANLLSSLGVTAQSVRLEIHKRGTQSKPVQFSRVSGGPERLLSLRDVERCTSLKKSTIYAAIAAGAFPGPIPITARRVAWRASEIQRWIAALGGRTANGLNPIKQRDSRCVH